MSRVLDVYLHDKLAGSLSQIGGSDLTFSYNHEYISSGLPQLSISLPLQSESFTSDVVRSFFSGLLPDAGVRDRLAKCLGISERNSFSLLEAIGGECAGAIAIYPSGEKPLEIESVEVLDDNALKEILSLLKRRPMLAGDDGYRISLAGAQNKLAVGFKNDKVLLVKGGTPTTHILKPLIDDITDSVHNELFCMMLAGKVGLNVPSAAMHFVDNTPYYLVERYDRNLSKNGKVTRVHQEDFCQALGLAPEIKYEREGGPSIDSCQSIILNHSLMPVLDHIRFLDMIIFNYLIGNADAHGKNFSFLYKDYKPVLAPAYDLMSTAIYPYLSKKMAMKIGGKYNPSEVFPRHFYKIVPDTQQARLAISKQMEAMAMKIVGMAQETSQELQQQGIFSDVFAEIIAVIKDRSNRLLQ